MPHVLSFGSASAWSLWRLSAREDVEFLLITKQA